MALEGVSDLGLDGIGSVDLLGIFLCVFLTVFSLYIKNYQALVVTAFAWLVVGFTIALATESPTLFLLFFTVSAFQLIHAMRKRWKA